MNSANLLLGITLLFSGIEIGASDAPPADKGGGIIGLRETVNAKITPSVFKSLYETETIEFLKKGKVKITKNGITFAGKYREADGSVTFKRTVRGKAERFLKADGVLIHEENRDLYFNEFALAQRKEFHRRVNEQ